ncbi:MAG: rRNA pseudouridine synthase [Acholeplasmatales bacterium]|nr:rRNA pseudouridine synthase [Acholeplasmatales bacterium]
MTELVRLQKYMASCGVASRRKSEELITSGRVKVNGVVVTELGTKVSDKDEVEVDGKLLAKETKEYYVINKPAGYLTTNSDKDNRKIVTDLIDKKLVKVRLFSVGRLDYNVSGALILTNDGDLSYKLTRSHKAISKTYQLRLDGIISQNDINNLIRGVKSNLEKTSRADVEVMTFDKENNSTLLKISFTADKTYNLYEIFESLGYKIKKMKRIEYAGITIDGLTSGDYRMLKPHEIKKLYSL